MSNFPEGFQIDGLWDSSYEYHSGEDYSHHLVNFRTLGHHSILGLTAAHDPSLVPNDSLMPMRCSLLTLEVEIDGNALVGKWSERTSLDGAYEGQIFTGHLEVIIDSHTFMQGCWISRNRDNTLVESGTWEFTRHIPDTDALKSWGPA